ETHTIEAMMQDGKALQAGTSHYLGQNFAHAAEIKFQDKDGGESFCHTTSWGVSTRMIGAVIMTHGDDDGLRVPPTIAPHQVIIIPIARNDEDKARVIPAAEELAAKLATNVAFGGVVRAHVDKREINPGEKRWGWIKKGAPIIVELGPRDLDQDTVMVTRRTDIYGKKSMPMDAFAPTITEQLVQIQFTLFNQALDFRDERMKTDITDWDAFKAYFENEDHHAQGFVRAYWCEDAASEEQLKPLGVSIRCLPYDQPEEGGACVLTGKPATKQAIFAKSY
ncbi:MAG: His/Gly/Thr/Pro-type tRNA ligase C-terminal domain-containing protein, partial [Magnetovibrio sp.]|nr:His/Gly/Thr/Pro-type tRNA ligase C-terminal domain-containing protein [Magnetovibrio sp.]